MDTRGFRKLRIATAAGLVGSSVVAGAPQADAAPSPLPFNFNGFSAFWGLNNGLHPNDTAFGGGNGLGFTPNAGIRGSDVSFVCTTFTPGSPPFCTTFFTPTTLAPAFGTGAFLLKVGTTVFQAPAGTIDVNGDTLKASRKIGAFKVEYRVVNLDFRRVAILYSFKNTKDVKKTARVRIGSELNTSNITDSSSGDTALGSNDAWFEDAPANLNSDPVLTIARGDCSTCVGASILRSPDNGNDSWVESYSFKVRPKKTKRLLFYFEMSENNDSGPDVYDNATSLANEGLLPFTSTEQRQIINWQNLG